MKEYIYSLYSVTAASIDRYLQLNGWIRNYRFSNHNMMVYTNSNSFLKTLVMSASKAYENFYPILHNIINALENFERRSGNEIIKNITTTFIDRLEIRVVSKITEDGKIPLEYAAECVDGLKELILYSACTE